LIADLSDDLSGDAAEKEVDDLFSGDVRFSDDDGGADEGVGEELTCRAQWQRQRESQRNSKQTSCVKATWPPGHGQSKAKKAAPKKKKTKAAKEHRALISEIERMRGRGGTNMTTGIKGSGLRDIKMSTQRWLDSKKSTNHPLVHGPPMCDVVHELLELPTTAQLNKNLRSIGVLNPGPFVCGLINREWGRKYQVATKSY
jgi:hypothetical protein